MDAIIRRAASVRGTLPLPADKAICHRAALLCALADGPTEITPWSSAEDCQRTLVILQQLGVPVSRMPEGIRIEGVGLNGLRQPSCDLDCGDSGTTMRLACGVLAGQPFESRLTAGESLRRRPMRRIIDPLSTMGARFRNVGAGEVYPPLEIIGKRPLQAIRYPMSLASAQVKSAILLAGLFAEGRTEIVEPVQTRDHTERLLRYLGVQIGPPEPGPGGAPLVRLEGPVRTLRSPARLHIPADPSSAAFFIVAALLVSDSEIRIPHVGLNESRTYFLHVLSRMGADIQIEERVEKTMWEPRGTIIVKPSLLHGTRINSAESAMMIDELPILMVVACAAEGETSFEGIQELTVKESDRLQAMKAGLDALSACPDVIGQDIMVVRHSVLRGAEVDSAGDHRIAMSLAVAGLLAEGETRIRHAECVAKSLGDFFELLASLTGPSHVQLVP